MLHEDRFFSADPTVRGIARGLYAETRDLPLVCPHGHVEPALLAENAPFPEPTALLIIPDHYIFRMLYSQGIALESLGIPTRDGSAVEQDPRRIWQRFAEHYHLFRGTPTRAWLDHELHDLFGVRERLDGASGLRIYDQIAEQLASPEFRPRALFERFNIELLATTDAATDTLEHHRAIRASGWTGRVVPTFRPDAVLRIATAGWRDALAALERVHGATIGDQAAFVRALAERRAFFRSMGATATDHAVVEPYTARLTDEQADALFQRARQGEATAGRPAPLRGAHAHGDGAPEHRGRPRDAAAPRLVPRPQHDARRALRRRQGRGHPARHGVHAQPAGAALDVRQRSAPDARALHARRVARTRASSRRSPGTIPRCASGRRGGSTTPSRA